MDWNELVLRSHFHKGMPAVPGTYEPFFRGIGCRTSKSLFASFDVLLYDRPPAGLPDLALWSPPSTCDEVLSKPRDLRLVGGILCGEYGSHSRWAPSSSAITERLESRMLHTAYPAATSKDRTNWHGSFEVSAVLSDQTFWSVHSVASLVISRRPH